MLSDGGVAVDPSRSRPLEPAPTSSVLMVSNHLVAGASWAGTWMRSYRHPLCRKHGISPADSAPPNPLPMTPDERSSTFRFRRRLHFEDRARRNGGRIEVGCRAKSADRPEILRRQAVTPWSGLEWQ